MSNGVPVTIPQTDSILPCGAGGLSSLSKRRRGEFREADSELCGPLFCLSMQVSGIVMMVLMTDIIASLL